MPVHVAVQQVEHEMVEGCIVFLFILLCYDVVGCCDDTFLLHRVDLGRAGK